MSFRPNASSSARAASRGDAVPEAGAAAAIRQRIGAPSKLIEREKVERTLAQARAGLGDEAYGAAWKEGHSAPLERILGLETGPRP